uniref:Peptidase A1 domain-containing protein n=1 Tax=Spongospora subterranea TaxID=70186 RepID=A0A0H5R351_9EUKA|eukprot:CRZ08620.1 hypothetical protein [Spongospora subterranea]
MDLSFANKYNIQIKPTRSPLTVSGFNRHKVVIGHETEPVQIQLGGFQFETSFLVVNNLSFPILLGYSWLMEHNPTIDWRSRTIRFPHTLTTCSNSTPTDDTSIIALASFLPSTTPP